MSENMYHRIGRKKRSSQSFGFVTLLHQPLFAENCENLNSNVVCLTVALPFVAVWKLWLCDKL